VTATADLIAFTCPECAETHRVPASLCGRKGRCSSCRTVLRVREGLAERYRSGERPAAPAREEAWVEFDCPGCGEPGQAPAASVGKAGRCHACRQRIEIPRDAAPASDGSVVVDAGSGSEPRGDALRRRRSGPAVPPLAIVGGLVAVMLLGLGGAAFAVSRLLASPDPLAYVPHDMRVVGEVDTRRLVDELELARFAEGHEAELAELGVDPLRDVDAVYFAGDPTAASAAAGGAHVVLVQGRFDHAVLARLADEKADLQLQPRRYRGWTYHAARSPLAPDQEVGFLFLRPDLLAVGGGEVLQRVIDTAEGAPSVLDDPRLAGPIAEGRSALFWCAVSLEGADLPQAGEAETVFVSADTRAQFVDLSARAVFANEDAAQASLDQLEGALGQLEARAGEGAPGLPASVDLDGVVAGKSVYRTGDTLALQLTLDTTPLKALADEAQ